MVRSITARSAALVTGGLLALGMLAAPSTASAAPLAPTADYPASATTRTTLSVEHTVVRRTDDNTATVVVTSGAGTPGGTVIVRVAGVGSWTLTLDKNGEASVALPTDLRPGTYQVIARYTGEKVTPRMASGAAFAPARAVVLLADGGFLPSADIAYYTVKPLNWNVLGEDAGRNDGNNRPGAVLPDDSLLPSTGSDRSTELLGLLGLGLVVAGGGVLMRRRLRHNH